MIKKIEISNIASYKDKTTLETDKKINLIYGLNGSGKTTLSNYLQEPDNNEFSDCTIEGFDKDNKKILVYNRKFIEKNFYNSITQKGIFTLGKDNKNALEEITKAKAKKDRLDENLEIEEKKLNEIEQKIVDNSTETEEKTWKIKKRYTGGDRVFDNAGFLNGLKGRKEKLLYHLLNLPLKEPTKTIEEIKQELQELGGTAEERKAFSSIQNVSQNVSLEKIEKNSIFQEEIIGNENSTIASLIKEFKNSNWVKEGLDYIKLEERKNCPFCQEETLTDELVKNIENYFDQTYSDKIQNLEDLEKGYQYLINQFNEENYTNDFFGNEQKLEITKLFKGFQTTLGQNREQIKEKIKNPSLKIKLDSSHESIKKINSFIETINEEIEIFNEKLNNREKIIEILKEEFWEIQRKDYNQTIIEYKKQKKSLDENKIEIKKSLEKIKKDIKEQNDTIEDCQTKVTNIEDTIRKINNHLLSFGIQDFSIKKHGETEYVLERKYEDTTNFKSLSEGEKTVISFLYFVQLCIGKEDKTDNKKKIIVFDDPISSLSHMYIFNVASLIKSSFFNSDSKEFLQCFVLTHSLYFFNELVSRKSEQKENQKLFRIFKNDNSTIAQMGITDIQNEYQSYWKIIKDSTETNIFLMANSMRNIIEYFFCFVEKADSINHIFMKEEFNNNKYQSFKRYIDRESHSDGRNIYDYKEFNYDNFKECFKEVFKIYGFENHYDKMMK